MLSNKIENLWIEFRTKVMAEASNHYDQDFKPVTKFIAQCEMSFEDQIIDGVRFKESQDDLEKAINGGFRHG